MVYRRWMSVCSPVQTISNDRHDHHHCHIEFAPVMVVTVVMVFFASQLPTIPSVLAYVLAEGGIGYISAVSTKLTPRSIAARATPTHSSKLAPRPSPSRSRLPRTGKGQ